MTMITVSFRLEAADRSTAEEYRIYDERIEMRRLAPSLQEGEREWHRLTPEQLTFHVENNTPVGQWLKRRLGWRRLLRACTAEETLRWFEPENSDSRRAA